MNAQNMQDHFKEPSKAVQGLQEYCKKYDLSYEITDGGIRIMLPQKQPKAMLSVTYMDAPIPDEPQYTYQYHTPLGTYDAAIVDRDGWPTSPVDESGHDPVDPLQEGQAPDAA